MKLTQIEQIMEDADESVKIERMNLSYTEERRQWSNWKREKDWTLRLHRLIKEKQCEPCDHKLTPMQS